MLLQVHAAEPNKLGELLLLQALHTGFSRHLLQRVICSHSRSPPLWIGSAGKSAHVPHLRLNKDPPRLHLTAAVRDGLPDRDRAPAAPPPAAR